MEMIRYLNMNNARLLFSHVRNPFPIILDKLHFQGHPYRIYLKDGFSLELRPNLGDRYVFHTVCLKRDYTHAGQQILPGDTVVDVGANIGCFSILAAKMVGPSGRVLALEPNKITFKQLLRNIELNHATNIVPRCIALGGQEKTVKLFPNERAGLSSIFTSVDEKSMDTNFQEVEMITLQKLITEEGIDTCGYLKIDCEGAEYEILDNLSLELSKRIRQITLEIHEIPNHSPSEIFQKLQELGFSLVSNKNPQYFRHLNSSH